jgi:hypothetical protein
MAPGRSSTESASRRAQVARPAGFEPTTTSLEGRCSIQLSYGRNLWLSTTWTPDLACRSRPLIRPRTHLPSLTCQIVARLTVCEQWDLRTPRAARQGEIHAGFRTQPSERVCPKHRESPRIRPICGRAPHGDGEATSLRLSGCFAVKPSDSWTTDCTERTA